MVSKLVGVGRFEFPASSSRTPPPFLQKSLAGLVCAGDSARGDHDARAWPHLRASGHCQLAPESDIELAGQDLDGRQTRDRHLRSNRSRVMTLVQAATKSPTN